MLIFCFAMLISLLFAITDISTGETTDQIDSGFEPKMPSQMLPLWRFLSNQKKTEKVDKIMKLMRIPPKYGFLDLMARCDYNGECQDGCCLFDRHKKMSVCKPLSADRRTCTKAQEKDNIYFVSCPCEFNSSTAYVDGYLPIRIGSEEFVPNENTPKNSMWPILQVKNGKESLGWKYLFKNQAIGKPCLFNVECESRCCVVHRRSEYGQCSALSLPGDRCSFGRLKGGSYTGFCPCASHESDCESLSRNVRGKGECKASKSF